VFSRAEAQRAEDADTAWKNRLRSLGLVESTYGDLPGFHFESKGDGLLEEGTALTAFWASGSGGIEAVVRNWKPEARAFDLDIVETSDGCTYRTYEWKVEPLSTGRSLERLRIKFYVPVRPLPLLKIALLWPLLFVLAKSAIHGRY
jgi:hypothetical protein